MRDGLYRATVAANNDPKGQDRVRLRVPTVFGPESTGWATPMMGAKAPGVGERVWAAFEAGDESRPVYFSGTAGTGIAIQAEPPENPDIDDLWLDTDEVAVAVTANHNDLSGLTVGDPHTQYKLKSEAMDLARWLHRRNAYGSGGGALSFNGSTLTGTQRYIWIPAQGGLSAHIELSVNNDINATWSITDIGSWGILYATLTDAEWAMTTKLTLAPDRFTFTGYNDYVPSENHLVLGWRNSDVRDNRLYLGDGRVLDFWRTPTLQNGWTSYSASYPIRYIKNDGIVHIQGLAKPGTDATTVFTLPLGYRPGTGQKHFVGLANGTMCEIRVHPTGEVNIQASNIWNSLDGVSFLAEG